MPIVPRSPLADNVVPFRPQLPEPWALMAAAQMHSEGRLLESDATPTVDLGAHNDWRSNARS